MCAACRYCLCCSHAALSNIGWVSLPMKQTEWTMSECQAAVRVGGFEMIQVQATRPLTFDVRNVCFSPKNLKANFDISKTVCWA